MGKTSKIVLGILSAWPLVYFGIFTQMIVPSFLVNGLEGQNVWLIILLRLLTFALCSFLFVYYLVKAANNNGVAWPVYWYLNIWKKVK